MSLCAITLIYRLFETASEELQGDHFHIIYYSKSTPLH